MHIGDGMEHRSRGHIRAVVPGPHWVRWHLTAGLCLTINTVATCSTLKGAFFTRMMHCNTLLSRLWLQLGFQLGTKPLHTCGGSTGPGSSAPASNTCRTPSSLQIAGLYYLSFADTCKCAAQEHTKNRTHVQRVGVMYIQHAIHWCVVQ